MDQAKKMSKERFTEILKEYEFTNHQIELLWNTGPTDYLDETKLRETAKHIAPKKDKLVQA